jgi:hypothetical protein
MRTSTAVTGAAAGLALALGLAGTAGAATAPELAAATPTTAAGTPAAVFVSSPTATPGQTIHVDGTCALPASGPMPTVVSVTSPAFTGPENFSKTDPDAFDGTATIRSNAAPGSYTVTLTCSNGTATSDLRVVAAHGGGTGTGGNSGSGTNAGTDTGTVAPAAPVAPSTQPAAQPDSGHSDTDSIALGLTVVAVVAAGAAGYVAVSRRRRSSSGKHREHAGV